MNVRCAVVIPVYRTPTPCEHLSLAVAASFFPRNYRYIVLPETLDFPPADFEILRLPDHYFHSITDYASMMVEKNFYEIFENFEYILVYQLDCLIFDRRLPEFCSLGYDYIAPLILRRTDGFWPNQDIVGVGGFSLRKVSSFLRVLQLIEKPEYEFQALSLISRIERNGAEDMFWSFAASAIDPGFSVASPEIALQFGFEGDPSKSYLRSNRQKPFGCHHWNKLSFFLWYLPWIPLPISERLRLFPPVLLELTLAEGLNIWCRIKRRARHAFFRI